MSTTDDIGTKTPSDQIDPATVAEVEQALGAARPNGIPQAETPSPAVTALDDQPSGIPQAENPQPATHAVAHANGIPQAETTQP